mmetsp:Transcript_9820/g.14728  ORF Transcript_9820/g.14728 Transcript_9820/m.14728 type:complete len:200 (-) Transcript_9820:219-818(-)|eukprot:CAMPEP_0116020098 /NCGR_PEP_ID=MMETSP0321-20121206/9607_1 /TAXON_ID=163516 /ORGANISM="Leptocylindrus danicus var. danicus, Strain B650" /LENGTH=199 /DNA_ID=CAMNT_0003490749 /DNA_START=99 /DNA_END=698 /DNA_ORIENTATION=-
MKISSVYLLSLPYLAAAYSGIKAPVNNNKQNAGLASNNRRAFLQNTSAQIFAITAASAAVSTAPLPANAVPMVTVDEFETILKDSYKSVSSVEFSGVKGETVTVKLVDGTIFGISDLIESPTDPRSPLKLVSTCKGYNIPTKFSYLDGVLSSSPKKKKKVYMNERVAEAAKKEEAKRLRIEEDEQARLKELYDMESGLQ